MEARDRARALRLFWPAWLVPVLFVNLAQTPEAPSTRPSVSAGEQVMAELRAANAARSRLLREEQAWALDKQKLELLRATVRAEALRLSAAAEQARSQRAELRKQTAQARADEQRLERIEAMIDTLCERLEKALAALGGRCLPGLVPPDTAAAITDPAERLAAAARRVDEARRRAQKAGVEIVVAELDGRQVTVKLLRAGGAAAWWAALDGQRAGIAAVVDGKLTLLPAKTPGDADAVRKAFAIAEGRAAPHWVLLPIREMPTE